MGRALYKPFAGGESTLSVLTNPATLPNTAS